MGVGDGGGGGMASGLIGQCLARGAGSLRTNMALLSIGRFPEPL